MRLISTLLAVLVSSAPVVPQAMAQSWPQQPVKIVVGLAAGGTTDSIARVIAQPLSDRLGQSFFIENRPGATGTIAAEQVARATPDGYTLVMANSAQVGILPFVLPVKYDPEKDLVPIAIVGSNPFALCVNASLPVNTLPEFVAYVRKQPGKLSYASGGVGNINHLSMSYFLALAGLDMIHVPYKGGAPAMADVVAGHVPAIFASLPDALAQARGGKVKILAVSGETRAEQLPDIPTVKESGYPDFTTRTWNGLMAPAGTPQAIIDKVAAEVSLAMKDKAVLERLERLGVDPLGAGPAEFATTIRSDIAMWKKAIATAGLKKD